MQLSFHRKLGAQVLYCRNSPASFAAGWRSDVEPVGRWSRVSRRRRAALPVDGSFRHALYAPPDSDRRRWFSEWFPAEMWNKLDAQAHFTNIIIFHVKQFNLHKGSKLKKKPTILIKWN